MSMSKKDYELIAAQVRQHQIDMVGNFAEQIGGEMLARRLARSFALQNPAFNMARFLAAAGLENG